MNFYNLATQIFGALALVFWVFSIQTKAKSKILTLQMFANIFYAVQYFLLGAFSASMMNITSTVRSFIYERYETKKKKTPLIFLIIFCIVIIIIGIITYTSPLSILPILITLAYCITTWLNGTFATYITFVICAIIWIYYNISIGAYISVIGNIFEIISGIIALIRFRKKV